MIIKHIRRRFSSPFLVAAFLLAFQGILSSQIGLNGIPHTTMEWYDLAPQLAITSDSSGTNAGDVFGSLNWLGKLEGVSNNFQKIGGIRVERYLSNSTDSKMTFSAYHDNNLNDVLTLLPTGRVGINTDNPQVELDINGGLAGRQFYGVPGTSFTDHKINNELLYRFDEVGMGFNGPADALFTVNMLDTSIYNLPGLYKDFYISTGFNSAEFGVDKERTQFFDSVGINLGGEKPTAALDVSGGIRITTGDEIQRGYILASEGDGVATWVDPNTHIIYAEATATQSFNTNEEYFRVTPPTQIMSAASNDDFLVIMTASVRCQSGDGEDPFLMGGYLDNDCVDRFTYFQEYLPDQVGTDHNEWHTISTTQTTTVTCGGRPFQAYLMVGNFGDDPWEVRDAKITVIKVRK